MGYTPPEEIDIGLSWELTGMAMGSGMTLVNKTNPANETGMITNIEIYLSNNCVGCEVATFSASGDVLTTRDTEGLGDLGAGYHSINVTLDVVTGDYIGWHSASGDIRGTDSAPVGLWYTFSDDIPCEDQAFDYMAGYGICLEGTGTTGSGELTIGEAFSAVDSLVKSVTKQLSEAFSIVDSFIMRLALGESFNIIDSIVTIGNKAFYVETIHVADSWIARIQRAEAFVIVDSLANSASLAKAEAFSIVDSWVSIIRLSESFQIVDSFVKTVSFYIAEVLGIADSYRTSTVWIEEIKAAVGWTEETKNEIDWTEEVKNVIVWTEETKI